MKVLHSIQEVVEWRTRDLGDRREISVGFVPTMGCLHAGHASLIKKSREENNYTVVSIFVNPSQFAPTEDLEKYPRTLPEDIKLLENLGVDFLFAPAANEMYPQGIPLDVEKQKGPFLTVLGVSEMLEGATRPNFFRGVATVVTKLFNIVMPDIAYFGQKDVQQFIVLDVMVRQLFFNTRLKMMPILRDENGLALSSRNKYLCQKSLQIASNIFRGLQRGATLAIEGKCAPSREKILSAINVVWAPYINSGAFKIDYLSIADFETLTEVEAIEPVDQRQKKIVISCAIYVHDLENSNVCVRLIDNIVV